MVPDIYILTKHSIFLTCLGSSILGASSSKTSITPLSALDIGEVDCAGSWDVEIKGEGALSLFFAIKLEMTFIGCVSCAVTRCNSLIPSLTGGLIVAENKGDVTKGGIALEVGSLGAETVDGGAVIGVTVCCAPTCVRVGVVLGMGASVDFSDLENFSFPFLGFLPRLFFCILALSFTENSGRLSELVPTLLNSQISVAMTDLSESNRYANLVISTQHLY